MPSWQSRCLLVFVLQSSVSGRPRRVAVAGPNRVAFVMVESEGGTTTSRSTIMAFDVSPSAALIDLDGSGFEALSGGMPATHPSLRPG